MHLPSIVLSLTLVTSGIICTQTESIPKPFTTNPISMITSTLSRIGTLRERIARRKSQEKNEVIDGRQVILKYKERGDLGDSIFGICNDMQKALSKKTEYDVWETKEILEEDVRILCIALHNSDLEFRQYPDGEADLHTLERSRKMKSLLLDTMAKLEESALFEENEDNRRYGLDSIPDDYQERQRVKKDIINQIDDYGVQMEIVYKCYALGDGVLTNEYELSEYLQKCRTNGFEMMKTLRFNINTLAKELLDVKQVDAIKVPLPEAIKDTPTDHIPKNARPSLYRSLSRLTKTSAVEEKGKILRWKSLGKTVEYAIDKIWSQGTTSRGNAWTIYFARDMSANERVFVKQYKYENCQAPEILNEELILKRYGQTVEVSQAYDDCFMVRKWGKNVETLSSYLDRHVTKMNDAAFLRLLDEVIFAIECAHARGILLIDTKLENILVGNSRQGPTFGFLDYSNSVYSSDGLSIIGEKDEFYSKVDDYQVFLNSLLSKVSSVGMSQQLIATLNNAAANLKYALMYLKESSNPHDPIQKKRILSKLKEDLGF